ncbi:MAG: hypothetical protein K8L99_03265, partial [Anaerolineae bacterium]|nr:hypothetical protein [Anaerolineae bacterium]
PLHRKQNPPSVQQILQDTQTGYQIISKYPGYNDLECILSEIDPDGWAAGGAWDNVNLNFRNTEYYASFVAAAFDKVSAFARQQDWDLRLLSWAFMFVGERCFEGTRTFSTQGIDKAIFNLFRLYAKLGNQAVAFSSSGAKDPLQYIDKWGFETDSDVSGFATLRGSKSLQVLVYNHHDDFERSDSISVTVEVDNLPFESDAYSLTHYRVDAEHSNAYAEWLRQDKPMYPAPGQYAAIKARDGLELLEPPATFQAQDGTLVMHFDMPTHSISLLVFEEA